MNTDYAVGAIVPFGDELVVFDVVDRALQRYELVMRRDQTDAVNIDATIRHAIAAHRTNASTRR